MPIVYWAVSILRLYLIHTSYSVSHILCWECNDNQSPEGRSTAIPETSCVWHILYWQFNDSHL